MLPIRSALSVGVAIGAPTLAIFVGSLLAAFRAPSFAARSVIWHFTAGVMFAVAAVEALPDLLHTSGTASAARGHRRSASRRWSPFARSPTGWKSD